MSKADSPDDVVTVVYTGTRRPTVDDPHLRIHHLPMLEASSIDFDKKKVQILIRQPCTLVFYSRNSVEAVVESGVMDPIDLSAHTLWAVGEKTAETLRDKLGVDARVPADERFDGIIEAFADDLPPAPIVAFSLKDSPRHLARRLGNVSDVHEVPVYHTCPKLYPRLADELVEVDADWVAFTSPRGVHTFCSQATRANLDDLKFAAIGPTTAAAMEEAGLTADLVMDTPDKNLMLERILAI